MTTRALTSDEISLIESELLKRGRFRDRLFFLFSVGTGFRVSEVLSLTWSHLLLPSGQIAREITIERAYLKDGAGVRRKAVRSRRVVLSLRIREAAFDYLQYLGSPPRGPVFVSRKGRGVVPIQRWRACRLIKSLARELGLNADRLGCHSTRKAFAMQIHRAAKFDLVRTQRVLGHASPLTTARYLETSQDDIDALVLGLDSAETSRQPPDERGATLPATALEARLNQTQRQIG